MDNYRQSVLEKIKEYEKQGRFNEDVEADLPAKPLLPNKVDYLNKKLSSKFLTFLSNKLAINFFEKQISNGDIIIKDIIGLENVKSVSGGAILTCNHINPCDNYLVYRAIKPTLKKHHYLYKVIKEGNYTASKGFFKLLFRHCNTLPLSSNIHTMKKFLSSFSTLLNNGEKILIYPEQSMWWNYKKPRPLKSGAFNLSAKNNVPVIPCFITMTDSEKTDNDGLKIPEYKLWFLPPIYPKNDCSVKENTDYLLNENYKVWKNLYEKVYSVPLEY